MRAKPAAGAAIHFAADTSSVCGRVSRGLRPRRWAPSCSTVCCSRAGSGVVCATGRFGADMQVTLTNDGPVTFWLQVSRGTTAA